MLKTIKTWLARFESGKMSEQTLSLLLETVEGPRTLLLETVDGPRTLRWAGRAS